MTLFIVVMVVVVVEVEKEEEKRRGGGRGPAAFCSWLSCLYEVISQVLFEGKGGDDRSGLHCGRIGSWNGQSMLGSRLP